VKFSNPNGANGQPLRKAWRMLREERTAWPASVPVVACHPAPVTDPDEIRLTFVGHSTFLVQTSAGNILTDPMFSDRASPFGFIGPRRARVPAISLADLPPIAMILLSHNHYDHCDLPSLRWLQQRFAPAVVTTLGNGLLIRKQGFERVEELDWWQVAAKSPFPVTATLAQHFSSRTPFDRNRTLWAGFVLEIGGRKIFFAGDSGYGPHFAEIGRRLGPFDLALLPIGAYEPRWFMRDVHMNPAEAVQAHLDLGRPRSIGMHFGTFQLTTEGIDEPLRALEAARIDLGVDEAAFRAPGFGETIVVR